MYVSVCFLFFELDVNEFEENSIAIEVLEWYSEENARRGYHVISC